MSTFDSLVLFYQSLDMVYIRRPKKLKRCVKSQKEDVSRVSDSEREFIRNWCEVRHIDDVFSTLALTYWVRTKARVAVCFILCDANKTLYMILCIHLSLKWLGYDECFKCNFFKDLIDVYPSLKPDKHRLMEVELLEALNWEMQ